MKPYKWIPWVTSLTLVVAFDSLLSQGPGATPNMIRSDADQKQICFRLALSEAQCDALAVEYQFKTLAQGGDPAATPQLADRELAGDILTVLQQNARSAYMAYLKNLATSKGKQAALQLISTNSSVNQSGSAASTSGATNLVSKPKTTDFISTAAESGAFTDTLNGSTATMQANANGLYKYFDAKPIFEYQQSNSLADFMQPLNFTVTMNVAQSSSSTTATTGSANTSTPSSIGSIIIPSNNVSFSAFSMSYSIRQKYNPQDKKFQTDWVNAIKKYSSDLSTAAGADDKAINQFFVDALTSDAYPASVSAAIAQWHTTAANVERVAPASGLSPDAQKASGLDEFQQIADAYAVCARIFNAYLVSKSTYVNDILAVNLATENYKSMVQEVLTQARGTNLTSISYTYSTPASKPAFHAGTLAVARLFKNGAQLTSNFTGSVYASVPQGSTYGRLRDVQLSAEFDKPFGGSDSANPRATLSMAGYGQYQSDPTVISITSGNLAPGTNITLPSNAQVLIGTSGWLGVVQGKIDLNLKQGFSLPVAVKWSNKTDLLQANDVRGQIGLSYDLSALSSLIK